MFQTDDALVIPLWIGGHAYLTMVQEFQDVRDPVTGKLLRRTPLCGEGEVLKAIEAAQAVISSWSALSKDQRAALLIAVGEALSNYAEHFSRLIVEETGRETVSADMEVAAAITLFGAVSTDNASGVVCIASGAKNSFLDVLLIAVPALIAGAAVVIRPNPSAPSALFALAELTARGGFPGGVFNIVHGNETVVNALRAQNGVNVSVLVCAD